MYIIEVPYRSGMVEIRLPESPAWFVHPSAAKAIPEPAAVIRDCLLRPIGTPPLRDLAKSARRVVVLVDDATRPTPQNVILPEIFREIFLAGITKSQITVLVALGTHRRMTIDEIRYHLGRLPEGVSLVQHDPWDEESLVRLGHTRRGTPIRVNRLYAEAELSIAVGNIVPHPYAGWGGGGKIVQPGIAGPEATSYTHLVAALSEVELMGSVENHVRAEIDEIAITSGLRFIVNTILNDEGELVACVAGDPIKAHRAGVRLAEPVYCRKVPCLADVVIASAYPNDIDFWQSQKALLTASSCTRCGGEVVLLAACPDGVSREHPIVLDWGGLSLEEVKNRAILDPVIDRIGLADVIATAKATRSRGITVSLYSDGISREEIKRLGFNAAQSVQEAVDKALRRAGPGCTVGVITCAGEMSVSVH